MPTPERELKQALGEMHEYWATKSSKGGIAEPTVVAGVIRDIIIKCNELWPKPVVQIVIKKRVLKRKV